MASESPSPNPALVLNQTTPISSPPPSNSSSSPPPRSSPPPAPPPSPPPSPPTSSPPPAPPPSPPTRSPPPTSPPPSPPASPPPSPPASPPPSPPASTPPSQAPPPESPPLPLPLPPPTALSPTSNPPPPGAPPPSPPAVAQSPPPKHSPPLTPPPDAAPPPRVPSKSPPHPPPVSNNSSRRAPPLPVFPTEEKPIARTNITSAGSSGGIRAESVAVVGSFVGFLSLTFVVLAAWILNRRKKTRKDASDINHVNAVSPSPLPSFQNSVFQTPQYSAPLSGNNSMKNLTGSTDSGGMGNSRSWFTYEELSVATKGFSANELLGQGGFGNVYKGVLIDGRQVAVKQLKAGGGQGEREFRSEVEIISRIHHKHLVSLVGYCIFESQRLLVYEYVPNKTLHCHLHDESRPVMDWASRVKVAAGAARGLAYLHEDCHPRIIHRDIKSTNILLDNNFEARVSDFGLAKIAQELDLNTHVSTRVMGTFGYLAPEYASSGKLTEKSDVYSFGVVLLELITGRMPVDSSQPMGDESLVECARPLLVQALKTQVLDDLVDPRLRNNFVEIEMFRMIEAAAACVCHSASRRPRMTHIARALDSMDELADLSGGIKPSQSGNFDSREHSARIRTFDRMAFGSEENSSDFYDHSQSSWRS